MEGLIINAINTVKYNKEYFTSSHDEIINDARLVINYLHEPIFNKSLSDINFVYESYSYKQANLIHGILSSNMKNWNISYKEFISLEIKERTEIDSNSKNMFSVNVDEIIEKSTERYEYTSKCDVPLKYRQLLHFFSTLLNKEVFNISDILFKEMNFSGFRDAVNENTIGKLPCELKYKNKTINFRGGDFGKNFKYNTTSILHKIHNEKNYTGSYWFQVMFELYKKEYGLLIKY